MRWLALALTVIACSGDGSAAPGDLASPRPVRRLVETARWKLTGVPVAFAADGKRWAAPLDDKLVVYNGDREVARVDAHASGITARLAPLPDGGWIAGHSIVAPDGTVRWDGDRWGHRFGRFGSVKAFAASPDGHVVIADGADSPSTCLCDRDRGTGGSAAGSLVRLTIDRERAHERVLVEHGGTRFHVAASATAVAAFDGPRLSVWPADGDGPAVTVRLEGSGVERAAFAGDRYLVATRYVALDRAEILVLDRDRGWTPAWSWSVQGMVRDLAVRPGTHELAIATTDYLATDRVLRDARRVAIHALDGTVATSLDLDGSPMSVAWSPRGDALLVAMVGTRPREQGVVRLAVR